MGLSSASRAFLQGVGGVAKNAGKAIIRAPGAYLDKIEEGLKKRDAARVAEHRRIIERNERGKKGFW